MGAHFVYFTDIRRSHRSVIGCKRFSIKKLHSIVLKISSENADSWIQLLTQSCAQYLSSICQHQHTWKQRPPHYTRDSNLQGDWSSLVYAHLILPIGGGQES